MSFRKKARPVIAAASVARSRQAKFSDSVEKKCNIDENGSNLLNVNSAPVPCDQVFDGPMTKDEVVPEDLCGAQDSGEILIGSHDSSNDKREQSIEKPEGTLKISRFKRVRREIFTKSQAKQAKIDKVEETSLKADLRDDDKEGDINVTAITKTVAKEELDQESLNKCLIEHDAPSQDHLIVLDILATPSNKGQSIHQDLEAEKTVEKDSSSHSFSSCSKLQDTDSAETHTGFEVTESAVNEVVSIFPVREAKNSRNVLASNEIKQNNKSIILKTESKNENLSTSSPGNRFKRRKIAPCLSRAGKKSNLRNSIEGEQSPNEGKHLKVENSDLNESKDNCTGKDLTGFGAYQDESPKLNSELIEVNALSSLNDFPVSVSCLNASNKIDQSVSENVTSNSAQENPNNADMEEKLGCKIEQKVESKIYNSICKQNSEIKSDINHEEKLDVGGKKSKRVRFKPNIVAKSNRSNSKSSADANSVNESLNVEAVSDISDKSDCDTGVTRQKVRFNEQLMEDATSKTELDNESFATDSVNSKECATNSKGFHSQETKHSKSHLGQHSDTEDGSQSEGEGIHHHSKRKFIPYLGPKVRQRRHLSSITLSEDEGLTSDKTLQDSCKLSEMDDNGKDAVNSAEQNETNAVNSFAKKKQKRKRIIIREPKEKMTMFDYIYYNPKKPEEKAEENEEEKKQQKRLHHESTKIRDSEIVLGSINGDDSNTGNSTFGPEGELPENEEQDGNNVIAPQVKIGEDGQIVIDEESLVLKTTRSKMSLESSEIVYTDNFDPYQRKQGPRKKKRWTIEETLEFYRVLSRIGTDFSFMVKFFPDCSRTVLKKKFKTEEKFNGDLIDRALKNMLPMDQALFEELKTATDSAKSRNLPAEATADIGSTFSRRKQSTPKRGKSRISLTNKNISEQNITSREEEIIQEEIYTMEVAENVII